MDSISLIINPGSTSKKLALFKGQEQVAEAYFESFKDSHRVTWNLNNQSSQLDITQDYFDNSRELFTRKLVEDGLLKDKGDIQLVAVRTVAPGTFFLQNHLVTTEVLVKMEKAKELAPLHLTPAISEIRSALLDRPDLQVCAISDSQFHHSLPETAYLYGIDYSDSQKFDIRRFGYHGISVSSVIRKLKHRLNQVPNRVIVCHLGGGCSVTAVKDGMSIDTSMGFTPLEGLVMSTRVGNIDPGAVLQIIREKSMDYDEIEDYLNKQSGLLGISQETGDMKALLDGVKEKKTNCERAVNVFIYRLKKIIGSYMAILGGIDYLVFTATIGQRSDPIRLMTCQGLEALGIMIDIEKNKHPEESNGYISPYQTSTHVMVIPTDEMHEIAMQAQELINA